MIDATGRRAGLVSRRYLVLGSRIRITEYGCSADRDFTQIIVKTGGRPRTEYLLTIGRAKELVMVKYLHITNRA